MMELETRDAQTAGIDFVSVSNSDRQLESITKRIDALAVRGERIQGTGATMIGMGILALVISGILIFTYAHDVKGSLRIINLPGYVVRDGSIENSMDYAAVAGKYVSSIKGELDRCKARGGKSGAQQANTAEEAAMAAASPPGSDPENPQKPGPVATESCTALQNGYMYMRAQSVMLEAPNAARDYGANFISDVAWLNKHKDDANFGFAPEADTMEQLSKRAAWMKSSGNQQQPTTAGQMWFRFIKNLIAPAFLLGGVFLGYGWLLGKRTVRLQRQMKKLAKG